MLGGLATQTGTDQGGRHGTKLTLIPARVTEGLMKDNMIPEVMSEMR